MPASVETASIGKVFGARLKKYRQALHLKQEVIGQAIGCSKSTISEIENGKHTPHLDNAVAIAEFFGMPLDTMVRDGVQEQGQGSFALATRLVLEASTELRVDLVVILRALADDLEATLEADAKKLLQLTNQRLNSQYYFRVFHAS